MRVNIDINSFKFYLMNFFGYNYKVWPYIGCLILSAVCCIILSKIKEKGDHQLETNQFLQLQLYDSLSSKEVLPISPTEIENVGCYNFRLDLKI